MTGQKERQMTIKAVTISLQNTSPSVPLMRCPAAMLEKSKSLFDQFYTLHIRQLTVDLPIEESFPFSRQLGLESLFDKGTN